MKQDLYGPLYRGWIVLRLSRLADYGIVLMTAMARHGARPMNAAEMAGESAIPLPMVSKALKALTRAGLLVSRRGARGGYELARPAEAINIAEVIAALDGPIALTACVEGHVGECDIEAICPTRAGWHRINGAIRGALESITLAEMTYGIPMAFAPSPDKRRPRTTASI